MNFANIPVLAANGVGAAVDVSAMGAGKTIVVGGPFHASITIEYATDAAGLVFAPVPEATFDNPGRVTIELACRWMRARTEAYKGGAANADVGGSGTGALFAQLVVGGPAVDTTLFPALKTVVVEDNFAGAINIEVSEDGVSWSQAMTFNDGGGQTQTVYAQFMRATGVGTPSVWLGAALPDLSSIFTAGFDPARTLFVAKSWPAGVDPANHFTSIAAAYLASVALLPTAANPGAIIVYPGTYADPISVVSNVHLVGAGQQRSVNIAGPVTWTAGAGLNAPQTGLDEFLNAAFITFLAAFAINTTAKTGGLSGPVFRGTILAGLVYVGRPGGPEAILTDAVVCNPGVYTFTDVPNVHMLATRARDTTFSGTTGFSMSGCTSLGTLACNQTGTGRIEGTPIQGAVTTGPGAGLLSISGCELFAPVTAAMGTVVDLRMTNLNGQVLTGPGAINRTLTVDSVVTGAGATPVVLNPPLPDGLYNVHLQLTAGPGNAAATITAKVGGGFTINDAIGGNTFDVTVIHN